jgi:hypothetical protein
MSGANARYGLPADERPPDMQAPTLSPAPAEKPPMLPGLTLEIERMGDIVNNELPSLFADLKLGRAQGNYALFESAAHKLSTLSAHVAKTITRERPRPPHRSATQEE